MSCRLPLLALLVLGLPPRASAVLWNATDTSYSAINTTGGLTDNYGQWTNVSYIQNNSNSTRGTATYLKDGWFLTARHVVQNGGNYGQVAPPGSIAINVYGQNYVGDQIFEFGSADIALVHVAGAGSGQITTLPGVEKRQVAGPGNGLAQIGGFGLWGEYGSSPNGSISFHRAFNTPSVRGSFLDINSNQNPRLVADGYVLGTQQGGDSGGPMWEANTSHDQSLDLYDWSLTGQTQTGGGTVLGGSGGAYGFLQSYSSGIWNTVYPHAVLNWNANPGAGATAADGPGVWSLAGTNFTDGTNFAFNGPERTEQVIFGSGNGAAGVVTLGATIPVTDIVFNAAGSGNYTIAASRSSSLRIRPHSRFTTNVDATISANITGGGPGSLRGFGTPNSVAKLIKDGAATLTLLGDTTLDAGVSFQARAGTTVLGGSAVFNSGFYNSVGVYTNESATMTLSGSSTFNGLGNDFNLADLGGAGTLNIQDTAALNVGALHVGKGWTRTVDNGTQSHSAAGVGTVNQTGGTVASDTVWLGSLHTGSVGTYNLNAGELRTGSIQGGLGQSTFNFNGGALTATTSSTSFMRGLTQANINTAGLAIDSSGHNITVAQSLAHAGAGTDGGLMKQGAGTLSLARGNTYNGATSVAAGTLVVDGVGTTGFGATTLSGGATLAGDGLVRGDLHSQAGTTVRVGGAGMPIEIPSGHVLLENFDGYGAGATTSATGGVWNAESEGTANSNIVSSSQGRSLQTLGGAAWRGAERNLSGTDAAVAVGETKTFFWQVQPSYTSDGAGWDYDFMMGLSPDVSNIDSTDAWQDFAVMPFINNEATSPFINASAPGTYWAAMSPGEWYNVWVVVNNHATNPSYDLYFSMGGNAAELVNVDGAAFWRGAESGIAPGVALNAIGFMAAGNAGTEFLVDNIYYVPGASALNPLTQTPVLIGETLSIGGDFLLDSTAALELDIAESVFDSVEVTGAAMLDGLLSVTLDPSYTPELNDVFTVLTAGSITNNLTLGGPNGSLFSLAASTATELVLTAISGLEGDFNNDGEVDLADFTVWRDSLGAPENSLFNDFQATTVGVAQYNAWKGNFGASLSPFTAGLPAAPEPTAVVLLLIGFAAAAGRRRVAA